jgi:phage/plasmid-like protein (TIGR03299 family)
MSHELDFSTGRAACFVAGEPAWHRLGVNVADAQTSESAIKLAALNWEVRKEQVTYWNRAQATWANVDGSYAIVRGDTEQALGIVGEFYRPLQNAEAFDFMDSIVGEKLAIFETAGALKGGRRVWCLAKLPGTIEVKGDDVVQPYILLTNSHDGTSAVRILPTTVRVVCQNTLNLALGRAGASGFSIVHTVSMAGRVAQAREALGMIGNRFGEFQQQSQTLARRSLNSEQLAKYFAGLIATRSEKSQKKLLAAFFENLHNSRNNIAGIGGTAWAAYNAVSEFADHQLAVTGKTQLERDDNRLQSIWFGTADRLKQAAWISALALVG